MRLKMTIPALSLFAIAANGLVSPALARPDIEAPRQGTGLGQGSMTRAYQAVRLVRAGDRNARTNRKIARTQRTAGRGGSRSRNTTGSKPSVAAPLSATPFAAHQSAASHSSVVAEARRHIGTNPTGWDSLWCARFMNQVLETVGFRPSESNQAHSFASYGAKVSGPRVGAIAVMRRGRRGGHVGVVSAVTSSGDPVVISGNYGRKVAEATIPRSKVYAYVMPIQ